MNFALLGQIDVWALTALLYRQRDTFSQNTLRQTVPGTVHHDTQTIFLRGPKTPTPESWLEDLPSVPYALLEQKEWRAAKNVLARVRTLVESTPSSTFSPGTMGKAMLVLLKPGGHVDWHTDEGDYAACHVRYHLPIVTNGLATMYSGGVMQHMAVGMLWFFNNRTKHAAINLGTTNRIHLIVDFRRGDG